MLGLVENLGLHGCAARAAKIYVGVLAATILFIATNAGVIGASRITYSMASYRQLPELFRRLHPRFKTPWLSLIVFAGIISIACLLPGKVDFLGTMYSFGAMLSFTIAHASVIALRAGTAAGRGALPRAAEPPRSAASTCRCSPCSAASAPRSPGSSSSSSTRRRAGPGSAGSPSGFVFYWVYRRRVVKPPLRRPSRAPVLVLGPSLDDRVPNDRRPGHAHRRDRGGARRRRRGSPPSAARPWRSSRGRGAARAAARRAARARGGRGRGAARRRAGARRELRRPRGHAPRCARDAPGRRSSRRRAAGTPSSSSLGAPRRAIGGRRGIFGTTVDYVLREAPCRVLIATGTQQDVGVRRHAHRRPLGRAGRARPRRDRAHAPGRRRRRPRPRARRDARRRRRAPPLPGEPLMPRRLPGLRSRPDRGVARRRSPTARSARRSTSRSGSSRSSRSG